MRGLMRIHFDELAELRERAAILCKETQHLLDDYRLLKAWCAELRQIRSCSVTETGEVTLSCAAPP